MSAPPRNAAPLAARLAAQTGPSPVRSVFPGISHALLLEPGGTLQGWCSGPTLNGAGEQGQGHGNGSPALVVGREATTVARAAAEAWLKEMGRK